MQSQNLRSALYEGSNWKNPVPLSRHVFLSPWNLWKPVTTHVEVDVVVSLLIMSISENLGVGLPLGVVDVGTEPSI